MEGKKERSVRGGGKEREKRAWREVERGADGRNVCESEREVDAVRVVGERRARLVRAKRGESDEEWAIKERGWRQRKRRSSECDAKGEARTERKARGDDAKPKQRQGQGDVKPKHWQSKGSAHFHDRGKRNRKRKQKEKQQIKEETKTKHGKHKK